MSNMFNFLADGSDSDDDTPKQQVKAVEPKAKVTKQVPAPVKKTSGGRGEGSGARSNNRSGGRGGGKGTRNERRTNARSSGGASRTREPRADRTGYAGRSGREYDRKSGTGRSGPGAQQRKEGAGGHNWGSDADVINSAAADQEAVTKDIETARAEGEDGAEPAAEVVEEEEDNEMSLEEYQAQLVASRKSNSEAFKELEKREVEADFEGAEEKKKVEEEVFVGGQDKKLRKKKKQQSKVGLDINFSIASSDSGSESRGKGKGKGGRSGERRSRDGGFKGRGGGKGKGKGGNKGGNRGLNVNDSSAFPTLG